MICLALVELLEHCCVIWNAQRSIYQGRMRNARDFLGETPED